MFKQLTAWFLIFTVFTANFSWLLVYTGFKLNQKYIAATLCENRSRPQMHCDGKCYLRKQLQHTEDNERKQDNVSKIEIFLHVISSSVPDVVSKTIKISTPFYSYNYCSCHLAAVFRPPKAAIA